MNRKEEILAGLVQARKQILDTLSDLPPSQQDRVFLGVWSITDLLAHLIGWDFTNIEAIKDIRAGQAPRVFKRWDTDWVDYNAELVTKYKREHWTEMLNAIHQSHNALIEFAQTIPAEEMEKDFGIRSPSGANITVEWFLQFEIDDEVKHHQQICDWLKKAN